MAQYTIVVDSDHCGQRIDIILIDFAVVNNLGVSRTGLQDLIKQGKVSIDGEVCLKNNFKAKENQKVVFDFEEKKEITLKGEDIPLEVLYEDNDFAIISKPIDIVVHPAPGNNEHTLVNALIYKFKNLSSINPDRPGIVHRLDKETSGLMIIAKNNKSHLFFVEAFSNHEIKKKYVALVKGEVKFQENIIEIGIARHPLKRESMSVSMSENAREAKTYYKTLKKTKKFSLLELHPYTGRTHQLRVHLDYIGHPILGDKKYGRNNDFTRLALHAIYLGFNHPSKKKFIEFKTNIPKEFTDFIDKSS